MRVSDMNKKLKVKFSSQRELLSVYIAFVVIVFINIFLDKNFLSINRLAIILTTAAPLVLAAMGQMLVILTGGIDLSVGNAVALIACVSAFVMPSMGLTVGIVACLLSGIIIGLVNGLIITYGKVPAIIVTLSMQLFWHGVALLIMPRPGGSVSSAFFAWVNGGSTTWAGATVILLGLIFWKLLKNTSLGTAIYAVGNNEKAAYASGLSTDKIRVMAYVLSGIFGALAGLMLSGITGSGDPNVGATYTMNSVASVIIGGASFLGGKGKMRGTVLGALFITLLLNVLFFSGLSSFYQYLLQGAILIIAVGLKSFGDKRKV